MSRFRKLSQTLWHCQYHLVFVPKYRFKILEGKIATKIENCIRAFSEQKGAEIIELNVQIDHVHLLVMIPPKISVSDYVGIVKGRTAIRIREMEKNHYPKKKIYSSRKIKKSLRSSDFKKQLLSAFQAVAS